MSALFLRFTEKALAVAAAARWGRRYRRQQGVAASGGMRPG
jgi:hypothetical protein